MQVFNAYFPSHPSKSVKLVYDGEEENFKNPNLFSVFNDEIIPESISEGAFNIIEDASKISVSELGSSESLFLKNYSTLFNINITNDLILKEKITNSNLLDKSKKYKTFYYSKNRNSILPNTRSPSVDISSSNINLYSRAGGDGIKLIKQYYSDTFDKKLNSLIRINDKGDIFLDANKIFIGNGEYHKVKSNFIEKNFSDKLGENKKYNGALVILGESNGSQQLVLGNQLKEYLKEILDVNREDMDKTKDLFRETEDAIDNRLSTLLNNLKDQVTNSIDITSQVLSSSLTPLTSGPAAAAPVTGLQAATAVAGAFSSITALAANIIAAIEKSSTELRLTSNELKTAIDKVKMKRDEELSQRLKSIEDNIDKILSKISKTS